jgi:hypothetical protein
MVKSNYGVIYGTSGYGCGYGSDMVMPLWELSARERKLSHNAVGRASRKNLES